MECRLVGAHLVGLAGVEERDQDVGEHALCRTQTPSATSVSINLPLSGIDTEELRKSLEQLQIALQDAHHAFVDGLGWG